VIFRFFQKCTVILPIFTVIFSQPYGSTVDTNEIVIEQISYAPVEPRERRGSTGTAGTVNAQFVGSAAAAARSVAGRHHQLRLDDLCRDGADDDEHDCQQDSAHDRPKYQHAQPAADAADDDDAETDRVSAVGDVTTPTPPLQQLLSASAIGRRRRNQTLNRQRVIYVPPAPLLLHAGQV